MHRPNQSPTQNKYSIACVAVCARVRVRECEREREREMAGMGMGAFWGTRVMEVVKRNNSPGLLWKRIKLTGTRKNNAKKRLRRIWQVISCFSRC